MRVMMSRTVATDQSRSRIGSAAISASALTMSVVEITPIRC